MPRSHSARIPSSARSTIWRMPRRTAACNDHSRLTLRRPVPDETGTKPYLVSTKCFGSETQVAWLCGARHFGAFTMIPRVNWMDVAGVASVIAVGLTLCHAYGLLGEANWNVGPFVLLVIACAWRGRKPFSAACWAAPILCQLTHGSGGQFSGLPV